MWRIMSLNLFVGDLYKCFIIVSYTTSQDIVDDVLCCEQLEVCSSGVFVENGFFLFFILSVSLPRARVVYGSKESMVEEFS